jgi:hypothetical protein
MPDVTVQDVLNDAMSLFGDADGEISQELFNDFQTAYSELMDQLMLIASPEVQREVYYSLPANTNVLFPSQLGVTDFAEPQQIWERGNIQTATIASVTDGTPITVLVTPAVTPAPSDGRVELNGVPSVPAYVNRDWFITATGTPGQFTLNGSITTGAGGVLATAGQVMWSSDDFKKMTSIDVRPPGNVASPSELGSWRWTNNAIYFPSGANTARQLWIEYLADESAPPSGTIGLLNGRELKFLSHATAANFCPKRQMPQGPALTMKAYGPSGQADASGGLLRLLINPVLKQKNQLPKRSGMFRLRRGIVSIT